MSEPPPYNQPGYPPQQGQPPAYQDQKGPPPGQVPPGAYPAQPYPSQPGYPLQQPGAYPPQQPGGYPAQPGYAPPPAGYAPPPSQMAATHTTTTVIAQPAPVVVTNMAFGEVPVSMTCPRCSAQIVTSTVYQDGTFAWLVAAVLCFVGCWPCCLLPFCLDGCKDVTHHCPNCRSHLGSYRRM